MLIQHFAIAVPLTPLLLSPCFAAIFFARFCYYAIDATLIFRCRFRCLPFRRHFAIIAMLFAFMLMLTPLFFR
jgi:hypothetical protein